MSDAWPGIRHFAPHEFDSPDAPGSGLRMDLGFIQRLQVARDHARVPFRITSGYRTQAHNATLDGAAKFSAHLSGHAADIAWDGLAELLRILWGLSLAGFQRIGVKAGVRISLRRVGLHGFVHVDDDPRKPRPALWTYPVGVKHMA